MASSVPGSTQQQPHTLPAPSMTEVRDSAECPPPPRDVRISSSSGSGSTMPPPVFLSARASVKKYNKTVSRRASSQIFFLTAERQSLGSLSLSLPRALSSHCLRSLVFFSPTHLHKTVAFLIFLMVHDLEGGKGRSEERRGTHEAGAFFFGGIFFLSWLRPATRFLLQVAASEQIEGTHKNSGSWSPLGRLFVHGCLSTAVFENVFVNLPLVCVLQRETESKETARDQWIQEYSSFYSSRFTPFCVRDDAHHHLSSVYFFCSRNIR